MRRPMTDTNLPKVVAAAHTPVSKPAESPAVFTFVEEQLGDIDGKIYLNTKT